MKKGRLHKSKDAQLDQFEKRDLGGDLKKSGQGLVVRTRQRLTSIFLDPFLIEKLKVKAQKHGLKYQTMLKTIVYEHVDEY